MIPRTFDDEVKPAVFTFRDCELDEAQRQLRRAGAVVEIEPQVLNLLFVLVRHRHRVMARAELRTLLWPEQRITDSAINACISRARAAVGERTGSDRIIKTFSRFGYRFLADVEVSDGGTSERRSASVKQLPMSPRLLGRAVELEWIQRALSRTSGARIIFVSGNTGIGKTRLVDEAVGNAARAAPTVVLRGCCDESDGPPPFWPWAQIIRDYAARHSVEVAETTFGSDIVELARLVPSLLDRRPEMSSSGFADAEQARLRIYSALAAFLRRAAQIQPLVIVLDDLQWVDGASLLMLRSVARDLATAELRVLGIFRDEEISPSHGLAALVGTLERDRACEHLKLSGIDSAALQTLLQSASDEPLDTATLTTIDERSEGNPLIALETLRASVHSSAGDDADIAVAPAVRGMVMRRLNKVGNDCRRILSLAAVIGREFSFAKLDRIAAIDDDHLIELIDEARRAGLISRVDTPTDSFRFVHPIFQFVLGYDLNPVRRRRLEALLD